jgi:ABC-2 type transport system ATP-binding protein
VEKVLEVNQLSKSYGNILAIKNLSFTVNRGEVYGLLGPNGSGKTTTLAVILDILKANIGNYRWFDQPMDKFTRRRIGSLLETPNFYPYLSLWDNLKIVAKIKDVPEDDINDALGVTNLLKRKYSAYNTLSLGMKQRLAIASVLVGNPEVLVLDEPTNGLDPEGFAEVRNIIQSQANEGKTIILASHILDEVEKVCSHVAILKAGDLIAHGRVGELLATDDMVYIQSDNLDKLEQMLKQADFVKRVLKADKDLAVILEQGNSVAGLNKYCFEKGFILSKILLKKQSLEDQFLQLVK